MSVFSNKLRKFFGTAWDSPIEKKICNQMIGFRSKLLMDEASAQGYLKTFCEDNADLVEKCSDDFKKALLSLTEVMAEAQTYAGVWENTSMRIYDTYERYITGEEIAAIKQLLAKKYNVTIKQKDKPAEEVLILKIPLKFLVPLSKDIRKVNPDLQCDPVDLNAVNHNIANRVNRLEREKEKKELQAECDTADISVYDAPVGMMRRKVSLYDPYKNIANKTGKTEVMSGLQAFYESMKDVNLEKIDVVATNMNEDVQVAKFVIKEGKNEKTVEVLKEMVIDYLVDYGDVHEYIDWDGKFDLRKYLKSRPKFMLNQMFRECFSRLMEAGDPNTIQVDDIHFGARAVIFYWGFPTDEESRTSTYKIEDFKRFCERQDNNYGNYHRQERDEIDPTIINNFHDWDAYWESFTWPEQKEMARRFLMVKGANLPENLNEQFVISRTTDYNEWKAQVATKSKNSYLLESGGDSRWKAVGSKGKVIGEWDPYKLEGVVYK